jgi:hypothetical protein
MVDEISNREFMILIIATIVGHGKAEVLIDEGNSNDIMYEELFNNLKLSGESLQLYSGGPLTGFDESSTHLVSIVILPITFHDGITSA